MKKSICIISILRLVICPKMKAQQDYSTIQTDTRHSDFYSKTRNLKTPPASAICPS